MLLHQYHPDALSPVAMRMDTLKMCVILHVSDIVLPMPNGKTDRLHGCPRDPEESQGNIAIVRRHHVQAPTIALQDSHIVDAHPVCIRQARILVEVDRPNVQAGIDPRHDFHQALGQAARRVLLLVKVE
jgi:hypothetical protein